MFLPSLPINLPFISSFGKLIVVTVWIVVTSLAYFSIEFTRSSFAFLSTSNSASDSLSLMYSAISLLIESSTLCIIRSWAFSLESLAILSNFSISSLRSSSILTSFSWIFFCIVLKFLSFSSKELSLFCNNSSLLSKDFSLWRSLSSVFFISLFLSLISRSVACCNLKVSSLSSIRLLRLVFSASFLASSKILFDFLPAVNPENATMVPPTNNPIKRHKMEATLIKSIMFPPYLSI